MLVSPSALNELFPLNELLLVSDGLTLSKEVFASSEWGGWR